MGLGLRDRGFRTWDFRVSGGTVVSFQGLGIRVENFRVSSVVDLRKFTAKRSMSSYAGFNRSGGSKGGMKRIPSIYSTILGLTPPRFIPPFEPFE